MAGVLLCLEYTRPWIDPRAKGKGKTKTRLWSTLLKRRIDWAVESQGPIQVQEDMKVQRTFGLWDTKNNSFQKCTLWRCVFSNHINYYLLFGRHTMQKQARRLFSVGLNEKCPLHLSPAGVTVWVSLGPFRRLSVAGGSGQIRNTVHHDGGRSLRFCRSAQLPVHSLLPDWKSCDQVVHNPATQLLPHRDELCPCLNHEWALPPLRFRLSCLSIAVIKPHDQG